MCSKRASRRRTAAPAHLIEDASTRIGILRVMNPLAKAVLLATVGGCISAATPAQQANGPLTPPSKEDHNVHRVTTTDQPAVPLALPPAEIIKAFAEKEDRYARARGGYGYKKTIKLTEYGKDGQPSGEYQVAVAAVVDSDGRV